jgi:hypothetical protein
MRKPRLLGFLRFFDSLNSSIQGTMPQTSRKFVVAYVLLVGLPMLGLAGVLRSGRSLVAPISIDGVWKIQGDASRLSGQSCSKTLTSLLNSPLTISQSGISLALTFNTPSKIPASGSLEGTSLKASIVPPRDSEAGCSGDQIPFITASVDPKSEPRTLSGILSVTGCASCAPVEFRAVRQPKATAGGAH